MAEHIAAHQIQRRLRLQRRSIKTDAVLQPCLATVLSTFNQELNDVEGLTQDSANKKPKPNQKVICTGPRRIEMNDVLAAAYVVLQGAECKNENQRS